MKDIKHIFRSFGFAMHGLRHAYRSDKSFRMEIYYGFPIYLLLGWLYFPMVPWELALFVFSYLLILIIELVNTAFEKMLDRVHPDQHELIAKSKDIAAAAVFTAFLFGCIVNLLLIYTHFFVNSSFGLGTHFV